MTKAELWKIVSEEVEALNENYKTGVRVSVEDEWRDDKKTGGFEARVVTINHGTVIVSQDRPDNIARVEVRGLLRMMVPDWNMK